jgi:hypothetical protein
LKSSDLKVHHQRQLVEQFLALTNKMLAIFLEGIAQKSVDSLRKDERHGGQTPIACLSILGHRLQGL